MQPAQNSRFLLFKLSYLGSATGPSLPISRLSPNLTTGRSGRRLRSKRRAATKEIRSGNGRSIGERQLKLQKAVTLHLPKEALIVAIGKRLNRSGAATPPSR